MDPRPEMPLTQVGEVDERELLRRYLQDGDLDARRTLVERLMPLVRSLARRYDNRGELLEDLEQVGSLGLLKAIERFDLTRDLRFSTFAVPTILGEIRRHFRDRTWSVHVSRGIQELNARISGQTEGLSAALGRAPRVEEIARMVRATPEQVLEALQGAQAFSTVPLDEPAGAGEEPMARLGSEDPGFDRTEERLALADGFQTLDERERRIVLLRFYGGLTQREIAQRVGVSQMHVSRLLRRSLRRMGETMSEAA